MIKFCDSKLQCALAGWAGRLVEGRLGGLMTGATDIAEIAGQLPAIISLRAVAYCKACWGIHQRHLGSVWHMLKGLPEAASHINHHGLVWLPRFKDSFAELPHWLHNAYQLLQAARMEEAFIWKGIEACL